MLTAQRKALLLARLSLDGRLVAADLARELAVSEDTIRRDLRDLAGDGMLMRVHGGALPASPTHLPLKARRDLEATSKQRLGMQGAALIQQGQVVILDGGTTHIALVAALPMTLSCTIVTHSPMIAAALEHHTQIGIHLIGGRVFRHSMVTMGGATHDAYRNLRADLCFLGVTGVHEDAGFTTGDAEEAALKAVIIRAAAETVVLATPDKIGTASRWGIAPLGAVSRIITDGARPDWLPAL